MGLVIILCVIAVIALLGFQSEVRAFFRRIVSSFKKDKSTPVLNSLLEQIPKEWDKNDYVLCGSATLAFRGIRDVRDLDILVSPRLAESLGGLKKKEGKFSTQLPSCPKIDVFARNPRTGLTFEDVRKDADIFEGYYVQSPRHTLAIKALVPKLRAKDVPDMLALSELIAAEAPPEQISEFLEHAAPKENYVR